MPRRSMGMRVDVSMKALLAELMATALFVYIGCGAATTFSSTKGYSRGIQVESTFPRSTNDTSADIQMLSNNIIVNGSWGIVTALAFGLAITVMAYATGHLSGGQMNPAVTLGLCLTRNLQPLQALFNVCAQITGAILGAGLLYATIPGHAGTLGSNALAAGVGIGNALCGEIVLTFVLVNVVLETAMNHNPLVKAQAPLAIGFAVFCAHAVLLPIDGCSINPARSLGPAIVSGTWPGTFWIFIVGPFLGGVLAAPVHLFFSRGSGTVESFEPSNDPLALAGRCARDAGTSNGSNSSGAATSSDPLGGAPWRGQDGAGKAGAGRARADDFDSPRGHYGGVPIQGAAAV